MSATDKWIEAIPEGRNERCPCGCGLKWKVVLREDNEGVELHNQRLANKEKEPKT